MFRLIEFRFSVQGVYRAYRTVNRIYRVYHYLLKSPRPTKQN